MDETQTAGPATDDKAATHAPAGEDTSSLQAATPTPTGEDPPSAPEATQTPAGEDTPSGQTAAQSGPPGFSERGRMRRRMRFLRKARELAYRDLGGLVFDLHRFGRRNDALVLAKLETIGRIDTELRALEGTLEERRASDRPARGRRRGVPALRRDPRQRRPLLPQLRPGDGPARRASDGRSPTRSAGHARADAPAASARDAGARACDGTDRDAHPGARSTPLPGAHAVPGHRADPHSVPGAAACARTGAGPTANHSPAVGAGADGGSADRDRPPTRQRPLSVATQPPSVTPPGANPAPPVDAACPLCGAPLDPRQEWCLSCGAAARTRLAAPTNWKAPIVAIAAVIVLALGVLAAALVKLSGGSPSTTTPPPITRTITTAAPFVPGATQSTIPTTTGGATGVTGLGGAVAPGGTGAVTPGTPTTIQPSTTPSNAGPTGSATTPTATTPTTSTATGSSPATEEALRKAGFLPRTKK